MISGLHYQAAFRAPAGGSGSREEGRLVRLGLIDQEYQRVIEDIKQLQRSASINISASLVEDILQELKAIAEPVFRSLTKLDVQYLAFRMQQMAVLSEAMRAIDHLRQNVDRVVISKELPKIFDELKVAILEVGYDFEQLPASEQLSEKIDGLRAQKLEGYRQSMAQCRTDMLRKKNILADLTRQRHQLERELHPTSTPVLSAQKSVAFPGNTTTPMPLSEIAAMIAYQRRYGGEAEA